jgi:hypothetical protein
VADTNEATRLLRSIDAKLGGIDATLKALLQATRTAMPAARAAVASDSDLDSQYGDPEIKGKDPRDWTGPTMRGRRYSECPADYLELLAERLDWQAEQNDKEGKTTDAGKPIAPYNRKDAARARGWALRIRDGKVPQAPTGAHAGFAADAGGDKPVLDYTPPGWGAGGF